MELPSERETAGPATYPVAGPVSVRCAGIVENTLHDPTSITVSLCDSRKGFVHLDDACQPSELCLEERRRVADLVLCDRHRGGQPVGLRVVLSAAPPPRPGRRV